MHKLSVVLPVLNQGLECIRDQLEHTYSLTLLWNLHNSIIKSLTLSQILDASKLKEFADDNFKPIENGRKLSKQVQNTVGKGEIARYEQFLLFLQCFQKTCTADT